MESRDEARRLWILLTEVAPSRNMRSIVAAWLAALVCSAAEVPLPSHGPFPPAALRTSTGAALDSAGFMAPDDCGMCHESHYKQWLGSAHSAAHNDTLYLAFAEMARKEGGDALYVFCSSCHAPGAVATGNIPKHTDGKEAVLVKSGVSCDVCHRVRKIEAVHNGAGANASITLDASDVRFGPFDQAESNDVHVSEYAPVQKTATFCSACHTLVHPMNGLVIENTYEEWRNGPYAKAGVQCQDCHMRSVPDALDVARGLKPVRRPGKAVSGGLERTDVHEHLFVGGNAMGPPIGMGEAHAKVAVDRLKNAVTLAVSAARAGTNLAVSVVVSNAAAGHAIPSSITELRQVWLDVRVTDESGREVFRSGAIDPSGKVDQGAVMYHTVLADDAGKPTYIPWRARTIIVEKLIPPKSSVTERYLASLKNAASSPLRVHVMLRYRTAPQDVVDTLFGTRKFDIPVVNMAEGDVYVPGEAATENRAATIHR